MKKIKKFVSSLLIISTLSVLTACNNEVKNQDHITIGMVGSIDAFPIILAQELNYFEKQGISVDIELFSSAKDRDAAMQAGELDAMISDSIALTLFNNSGLEMKSVSLTNGRFTLVSSKDSQITTSQQLANRSMAISQNTLIDFLSYKIINDANVDLDSVEMKIIPAIPMRLEALSNGQVDAAILPAPFDEIAISQGANKIETFENSDVMLSHIVFTSSFIEVNQKAVDNFLVAYDKAIDYINSTDISEFEALLIEVAGYPESSRNNITLPPMQRHIRADVYSLQEVIDWTYDRGLISQSLDARQMILD